jgi:hypothetical protein
MEKMIAEVDALRNTDCRLAKQKLRGLFEADKIPNILHEILLREITFREVGEGRMNLLIWTNMISTTTTFFYGMRMQRKLLELIEWA